MYTLSTDQTRPSQTRPGRAEAGEQSAQYPGSPRHSGRISRGATLPDSSLSVWGVWGQVMATDAIPFFPLHLFLFLPGQRQSETLYLLPAESG